MSDEQARVWLIKVNLCLTSAVFAFFLLAPAFEYPLTWDQSMRMLQIVAPVLLGYLGSASHFIFVRHGEQAQVAFVSRGGPLFPLLVRGPVVAFAIVITSAIIAFGYSNRLRAAPGIGMSVDTLAVTITAALGILAATTSVLFARLFAVPANESDSEENDG